MKKPPEKPTQFGKKPVFAQIHRIRVWCSQCAETMKPKNKSTESISIPETLQNLLPIGAVTSETLPKISSQFLQERYEAALGMKTESPMLSSAEQSRFQENSRIIEAATLGLDFRNYLLWEVHSMGQFRETDQDFEAYGARVAKLKKAQLMRSVHAGRIRMAMIHASMDDVGPTGRQVEELSKIENEHTVQAWSYALEYMRIHGRSDALAREGLVEYCRIKKIRFGKRMPNGSRVSGLQRTLRSRPKDPAGMLMDNQNPDQGIWKLSESEERLILGIEPESDASVNALNPQQKISHAIESFRKIASMKSLSEYEAHQFEELLALVMRKDKQTGRSLVIVALQSLRELLMNELQSCDEPENTES